MSTSRGLEETIENPTLELKIISASDVTYIYATKKLDVYAIVSIKGKNAQQKQAAKTPIDYDGGSNPTWNHTIKFSVNEREVNEGLLTIYIKLFSYWLEGEDDLYLGEVSVSVQDLLATNPLSPFPNPNGNIDKMKSVTYPVKFIGETIPNAKLSLSYRFKPVPVKDLYPPVPEYSLSYSQPVYANPEPIPSGQPVMYSPQLQTTTVTRLVLDLEIKFAKAIKKVNIFDKMAVYASVAIREGKNKITHRSNTPISYYADQNSQWNHAVKFSLDERLAQDGLLMLSVQLMSHGTLLGDKEIGVVNVSIKELLGLNPPLLLPKGDGNDMMVMTQDVSGSYGKKGTLSFRYRFLTEKVTVQKPQPPPNPQPSTNPQPFIMYLPVSHQAYASHCSNHVGLSNGLVPIYMPSLHQSNEYQPYSPHQSQPQESQVQPQAQQPQPQPSHDTQSQPHQSYIVQHYSSPEPLPPQRPTQSQAQTKPENGTMAAIGVGAAVLGRTIGGALLSELIYEAVGSS